MTDVCIYTHDMKIPIILTHIHYRNKEAAAKYSGLQTALFRGDTKLARRLSAGIPAEGEGRGDHAWRIEGGLHRVSPAEVGQGLICPVRLKSS